MEKLSLGEFLSVLRKGKGLKQEELAEKLGVSSKTVSSWENRRTYPDIVMLPIIADFFDITVDELVRGEKKNSIINKKEDEIVSSNSLLKLKKIKYAKYKEKNLLFTILAAVSSLVGAVGFYLTNFIALWTLVFAVLGALGTITFLVLNLINGKRYLNNEGILTSEDYVEENHDKILYCRVKTLMACLFAFVPYLLYGLIIVLVYLSNNDAYVQEFYEITIDSTKSIMTCGIVVGLIGLLGILISYILFVLANKKYGNSEQKRINKKNNKLVVILSSAFAFLLVFCPAALYIHDCYGPVRDIYSAYYVYDSYQELVDFMHTYTVQINELEDAGLINGTQYVLNLPTKSEDLYDQLEEKQLIDAGNGFVYCCDLYNNLYNADVYIEIDDEEAYIGSITCDLLEAYVNSKDKTKISYTLRQSAYWGEEITIPVSMFTTKYCEYGYYYLDLIPGTYNLNDNFLIKIENQSSYKWNGGLYYRNSENQIINEWVDCYDAKHFMVLVGEYTTIDNNKVLSFDYVTCISNKVQTWNDIAIEYILGLKKQCYSDWGYMRNGPYKGKYGYYHFTEYYVSDLVSPIETIAFFVGFTASLVLGLVFLEKQKYELKFKS